MHKTGMSWVDVWNGQMKDPVTWGSLVDRSSWLGRRHWRRDSRTSHVGLVEWRGHWWCLTEYIKTPKILVYYTAKLKMPLLSHLTALKNVHELYFLLYVIITCDKPNMWVFIIQQKNNMPCKWLSARESQLSETGGTYVLFKIWACELQHLRRNAEAGKFITSSTT